MEHEGLPQRWKDRIKRWLVSQGEHQREKLCTYDFYTETIVKLTFEDGSYAEFNYSLVIEAPEINEGGTYVLVESRLQ